MRKQRYVHVEDATTAVTGETLGTGDGVAVTFSGTLANTHIEPTTLFITDGTQNVTDNGQGALEGAGTGTINYDTGEYSVTFNTAPASGASITSDYEHHETTDITTTLAGSQWTRASVPVGGREESASRVPSSYEVRRDQLLKQTIRFTEAEWPALRNMLEHGQRGSTITVYPDASLAANRVCYLKQPSFDELIEARPSDYPGDLEVDVTWVDSNDVGWDEFNFYG